MAFIYDYRCNKCGSEEHNVARKMSERKTNAPECCGEKMGIIITAAPMGYVDRDIHYVCPVTNEKVTSRRQRNELMKRNNLMDANDFKGSIQRKMKQAKENKEWQKKQDEAVPKELKREMERMKKEVEREFNSK